MDKVITFNGRFLGRRAGGVERVALEILRALDSLIEDDALTAGFRFQVMVPRAVDVNVDFNNIEIKAVGVGDGQIWEQVEFPFYAKGTFVVNFCNTGPAFFGNQAVIIHDVATVKCPGAYGVYFKLWYSFIIPRLYAAAKIVYTVSDFSRSELRSVYGERSDVSILPLSVDHMKRFAVDDSIFQRHGIGSKPYVLAVGSLSPHKNFAAVLEAFDLLDRHDVELVIAGGANCKVFSGKAGLSGGAARAIGYVSDAELKALYQRACCFVFPSLYEGYGLPPVEAMSCGCPVLASNAASIPEVCGNAVAYFDPHAPAELAALICRVVDDSDFRQQLSLSGLEHARKLSWRQSALVLLQEIRKILL